MSKKKKSEHTDGIIYMFTNKINGKRYIGQTVNEKARYNEHRRTNGKLSVFHKAIKKYGFENFTYKVLFRIHCNNEQDLKNTLNIKEIISIRFFKSFAHENGYNLTKGGEGSLGIIISEERRKLMSERMRGKNHPMYGKHHSDLSRKKISQAGKRRKYVKKESKKHKKIVKKSNKKPVIQFSLDGKFIKEWSCIGKASRELNINKNSIKTCCRSVSIGKSTNVSACGFMWRFKKDWNGEDIEPFKKPLRYIVEIYDIKTKVFLRVFNSINSASKFLKVDHTTLADHYKLSKIGEFEFKNYYLKIKEQ